MDILLIVWGSFVALIGAFGGAFMASLIFEGLSHARIEARINSIEAKMYSSKGLEAKAEKSERLQEAIIKAASIMKDENVAKEDKSKAIMALAAEYPDVALDLVKKVGMKGLF